MTMESVPSLDLQALGGFLPSEPALQAEDMSHLRSSGPGNSVQLAWTLGRDGSVSDSLRGPFLFELPVRGECHVVSADATKS